MPLRTLLIGGLSFALFLTAHHRGLSTISISTDEQIKTLGTGFYTVETSKNGSFVWTSPHAELALPRLERRIDWRLTGRVKLHRPRGVPMPTLRVTVDGQEVLRQNLQGDTPIDIIVPARPEADGVRVTLDTTPSFLPGGGDPRELGVALDSIALAPQGSVPPPLSALVAGTLAVLFVGAAMAASGPLGWRLDGLMVLLAWGVAWLMTQKLALYAGYPVMVALLAAGVGAGTLVIVKTLEKVRREALSTAARAVVAISLVAGYLKLLVLLHPSMPIGDGVFHAHRFEFVLRGQLYFTSVAPGDYAFPYPVLLYIVAAPFSLFTSDTLDRVALLRIVTTGADAVAGALLYWMIARSSGDRLAGIAAVIWYHAIPMTAWIMTWGNLTNAFGQSLFVASLTLVVALPVEGTRRWTVVLLAAVASAALLSHPSTFAILTAVLTVTAALFAWRGGQALRSNALGVAVAAAAALGTAVVLYYAWFPSVYVSELGRVAADAGARVSGPTSSLATRLATVPLRAGEYFGWAVVLAAGFGVWRAAKNGVPERLTLMLAAWIGICLVFLVVGVLSPMELRYHFAVFPALAVLAAYAFAWAWRGTTTERMAALAVLGAGIWAGVRQWTWGLSW